MKPEGRRRHLKNRFQPRSTKRLRPSAPSEPGEHHCGGLRASGGRRHPEGLRLAPDRRRSFVKGLPLVDRGGWKAGSGSLCRCGIYFDADGEFWIRNASLEMKAHNKKTAELLRCEDADYTREEHNETRSLR